MCTYKPDFTVMHSGINWILNPAVQNLHPLQVWAEIHTIIIVSIQLISLL